MRKHTRKQIMLWVFALLFALPFSVFGKDRLLDFQRASVPSAGGIISGNVEFRNPTVLAGESLQNGALTGGANWSQTGDFALAANAATYTHSAGSGTFFQASASALIPWATTGPNGWFQVVYTTSAVTGTPVCTISSTPSAFVSVAVPLSITPGTYTIIIQAQSGTVGNFKFECTSAAAATVTFDNLSLKQINGGNLTVQGSTMVSAGTCAAPSLGFLNAPTTGLTYESSAGFAVTTAGVCRYFINGSIGLYPAATDTYDLGFPTLQNQELYLSRATIGSKSKTLTDAGAAVAVWSCAVPTSDYLAGEVVWAAKSTDATDFRVLQGRNRFTAVNKAGTLFTGVNASSAASTVMNSIGTDQAGGSAAVSLTCTWTQVINGTNLELSATCTDSTAGTQTMTMNSRLDMPLSQVCTPQ